MSTPRKSRLVLLCVAYVVLHFFLHVSANWFEVRPGISVSIWYPPCGLAFALLLLLGPRYAGLVFAANFATAWVTETPREVWAAVFFPALLTLNYGLSAWLVRRYFGVRLLPGESRGTLVFLLAVGVAPWVSAVVATSVINVMTFSSALSAGELARSALDWWIGDASGLLVVVPAVVVFAEPWLRGRPRSLATPVGVQRDLVGDVVSWALLVGTLLAVIVVPALRDNGAVYLAFLPLVWICVRHGLEGATLATLFVMIVGLIGMRVAGTTREFSYIFLLFEVAVAGVGLGLGTLVSRRNEAEQRLAASEAQLERVIAGAQLGMWEWDVATQQVAVSRRLAEILGYARHEAEPVAVRWAEWVHPEDQARADAAMQEHLAGQSELYETELRFRAKNGTWRWIQSRGSVVLRDADSRPLRVAGTHADITDRKLAEAEVSRLLQVLEATPDFVLKTDGEGRVLYANAAWRTQCETAQPGTPVTGRGLEELFPGEAGQRLQKEAIPAARRAGAWRGEVQLPVAAGRTLPTSQVVLAHHEAGAGEWTFSFIMHDLSAQKEAEAERLGRERHLLQLQKNESLVVLAGGMAHDFNNLMTAVIGNANLARFGSVKGSDSEKHLADIESAALRAAALCQQMLAYAGRTPLAFAEIELNALVSETLALLDSSFSKKIAVMFKPGASHPLILATKAQMQQVLTNLLSNAADAIGEREGWIVVTTQWVSYAADVLARAFPGEPLAAGDYVELTVRDNGAGMTPAVRARIFEPFFTTKFAGQGLGLAAVSGVVRSHRGAIAVESAPQGGSTFRIVFPALAPRPKATPKIARPGEDWQGSGLVLLVDDDPLILGVGALMLKNIGFESVSAKNGVEAVEVFLARSDQITCVLMDITMPRMDGLEAHAAMHAIDPAVPVILMSGYSQKLAHLPPHAVHPQGVLAKPFSIDQLRARLAEVVETAAS